MFANRLSGIKMSEHRQDKDFIEFSAFPMPEQRKIEKWTIFFKSWKGGRYRVRPTGYSQSDYTKAGPYQLSYDNYLSKLSSVSVLRQCV